MRATCAGGALLLVLAGTAAYADGGRLQLREHTGDVVLSVWTAPTPLVTGMAEVLVTVEPSGAQGAVEAAGVELEIGSGEGRALRATLRPIRGAGGARAWAGLATVELREPGEVELRVRRKDGGAASPAEVSVRVVVERPPSPLREHWLALGFPFFAMALFGLSEWRRSRAPRSSSGRGRTAAAEPLLRP